jgi:S1-C subfamily serine protease
MTKFTKDLIGAIVGGFLLGGLIMIGIIQVQNINKKVDYLESQIYASDKISDYNLRGVENSLNQKIKDLPNQIRQDKIKLEQTLKQINVMVVNEGKGLGSGVSIKYKGKFYVLTAGHMAENPTDDLALYENGNKICKLVIVKQDYTMRDETGTTGNDLLLLKPENPNIQPRYYVELADNEPITGTEVTIVGNPLGIEDVISIGRIAIYKNNFMYFRDSTYFGNSGCGIYNDEEKLVGIMSHVIAKQPNADFPAFVIEGAVRLNTIKKFLEDIK